MPARRDKLSILRRERSPVRNNNITVKEGRLKSERGASLKGGPRSDSMIIFTPAADGQQNSLTIQVLRNTGENRKATLWGSILFLTEAAASLAASAHVLTLSHYRIHFAFPLTLWQLDF